MEKQGSKPTPEQDDEGTPIITLKYLKDKCEHNSGYITPELNDRLFLNCMGFKKVQNLELYTQVKILFLEGNCLTKIEGINHMTSLRTLLLQDNLIKVMEGLDKLVNVDTLNLSNNMIFKIEGIQTMKVLKKLDMSGNRLASYDSISEIRHNPAVTVLNLKENQLDYDVRILDLLGKEMSIKFLEMRGTLFAKNCPNYRKTIINELKDLCFLEDRPVTYNERRQVAAYFEGGHGRVEIENKMMYNEVQEANKRHMDSVRKMKEGYIKEWEENQKTLKNLTTEEIIEQLNLEVELLEKDLLRMRKMEKVTREKISEDTQKEQDEETFESLLKRCENVMINPESTEEQIETAAFTLQNEISSSSPDKEVIEKNLKDQKAIEKKILHLRAKISVEMTKKENSVPQRDSENW